MALIRGGKFSHHPCPRCLVRNDELEDLSKKQKIRTVENMKEVLESARGQPTKTLKEEKLKGSGLRDIDVRHFFY